MQINQPRLTMRTLDPRILPRGPDFTPAFADIGGRQTPGGRGVPVSASSLPQPSQLGSCGRHRVKPRERLLYAKSYDQEVEEAKTVLRNHTHMSIKANAWCTCTALLQ